MATEFLTVPVEWKSTDDTNTLEGYASTFGNVDLGGDVVERGAFTKTIKERVAKLAVPFLTDHIPTTDHVVGTIIAAEEDSKGLRIRVKISSAPSAQDFRIKALEGHINRMSIGYEAVKWSTEESGDTYIRHLQEVKLYEVSGVVFPMNPKATIERVKSLATELADDAREAMINDLAAWVTEQKASIEPKIESEVTPEAKTSDDDHTNLPTTKDETSEASASEPSETSSEPGPAEDTPLSLAAKIARADALLRGRDTEGAADPQTLGRITALFDVLDQWVEDERSTSAA